MGLYSFTRSLYWLIKGYPANQYSRFLQRSEQWTREQLTSYRNTKLQRLVIHCYEDVSYYKRIMDENGILPADIRSAEDLNQFPLLTKDDIRFYANDLLARNISNMKVFWAKTGGTTGEPMQICKNTECIAWENMCYERGLRWGGLQVDEPRINLFGGSLGLGLDTTRLRTKIENKLRRDLFLPAFELRADTAMSYFEKIRRSRGRHLVGYSSAIFQLAKLADELNQSVEFDAVFPTAELMLPEWEQVISKIFRCAVLPFYGCGEVNSLGYSALKADGYFIPDEHAVIEVMKTDGSVGLSGDGQFVITNLDNYAMPTLRYVNGDAGKISNDSDQDLPFSRIERLDGRFNSFLMADTGDLISGVIGTHIFRLLSSVESYRIIQEEPLRLRIQMVPKNSYRRDDEQLIINLFKKHLGQKMNILIERVQSIPRPPSGKAVFVINRCLENPFSHFSEGG